MSFAFSLTCHSFFPHFSEKDAKSDVKVEEQVAEGAAPVIEEEILEFVDEEEEGEDDSSSSSSEEGLELF